MKNDLHPLALKLLENRGVVGEEDIEKFLNPSYERDIGDPFSIYGMEKAVKRIIKAIKNEEKIIIYSDYDCDGVPGGVLLRDFFRIIGYGLVDIYIPHRHNEGYGIHKHAIDKFKKEKVSLVITVDCGITNIEEIKYAEGLGINVIVTDHHLPINENKKQSLPDAYCILNSKQDKCEYYDDMLCGCAVVWKLAVAVLSVLRADKTATASFQESRIKNQGLRRKIPNAYDIVLQEVSKLPDGYEKWWLDLVAISTVADMVPLVKENRALTYFGLKVLQKTKRHGLNHIFNNQKVSKDNLTEEDIAFTIAPRINAASRMGHPVQAHNMLYEKDNLLAEHLVLDLEFLNNERKGGVKNILSTISFDHSVYKEKVIVVGDENWGAGLLGLIAQAIIEETGKPTFVWGSGEDEEILKGSCRSLGDVHVVDLMKECRDIFLGIGGHEQAGGFSFKKENKDKLLKVLNEAIDRVERKEISKNKFEIDAELKINDVTMDLFKEINKLSPFGMGNPKPVFEFKNVKPVKVKEFGKMGGHLEIIYDNGSSDGLQAIAFGKTPKDFEVLNDKQPHTLIARIEKSTFMGKTKLRLKIEDVIK